MGRAFLGKNMHREAIEAFQRGWALSDHRDPIPLGGLGNALALTGDRAGAEKVLDELLGMSKDRYVRALHPAIVYIGLGQKDQALDCLERAYREHDLELGLTLIDFRYDSLRSEPRYTALLKKMGLR